MNHDDAPFTDPCSRCGRPLWSDDGAGPKDGECYEIGGADCELHGQLRDLRSQLRASEAECERLRREVEAQAKVIDAADVLAAGEGSPCEMASAYDAAKAELERVELPPQPQPSERVDDATTCRYCGYTDPRVYHGECLRCVVEGKRDVTPALSESPPPPPREPEPR